MLGVPIGASKDEIAAAYRGLAKRYHPDLLGDASPDAQRLGADRMAEANVALATLRHLHRGP